MNRRATYALMVAVVVIVSTWMLVSARNHAGRRGAELAATRAERDVPAARELPVLNAHGSGDAGAASPTPIERAVDTPVAPALEATLTPLIVRVTHADGEAARGAEVELYDGEQHFLARARLDALGAWHHPAQDSAGVLLVLGATTTVERFDLPQLTGRHDLSLPAGEIVSGRLLVNGEPPGERVPLSVRVEGAPRFSWAGFEDRPESTGRPGHWPPVSDRRLLTDTDGSFRISGLPADAELRFGVSQAMELLEDRGTPLPVFAPARDVLLHARRFPVLRGRLLDLEGLPARNAELRVGITYSRPGTRATSGAGSSSGGMSWSWEAAASDGRFAISLGLFPDDWAPYIEANSAPLREGGILRQDIEFSARDADGNWLERVFEDIDTNVDHDLGDLPLQPVQRWRLRIVDADGAPLSNAQLRPNIEGPAGRVLSADADGRIDLDLGSARITTATLLADGFEARLLDLPATAPDEIVEFQLAPSTRVELRLHGVWDDERFTEGWRFLYTVSGAGPVFHDAQVAQAYEPGARGFDAMRASPPGGAGTGTGSNEEGEVWIHRYVRRPSLLFDGLRAQHPITLSVAVRRAPEGLGPSSDDALWSEEVWLERGQLRVIDVDLSEWFPPR